jgi:AraC family transcriptional regulator
MTHKFSPVTLGEQLKQFDAGAFALTEAVYPPSFTLPRHAHGCATISFVLRGSCTEVVGNSMHECVPYNPILKPAGAVHSNRYGRAGAKCLLIEIKPEGLEMIGLFSSILDRVAHLQEGSLTMLAMRIHREFRTMDSASALSIEGLVLEMMAEATRRSSTSAPQLMPPRWLSEAKNLCQEHFMQPISLISIAESIGIHPSHLARMFRRHYRSTLGEYVRRLRLDYAVRELTQTCKTLAEIASASGFYDHSHFTHAFKLHTGMTPTEFRSALERRKSATTKRQTSKTTAIEAQPRRGGIFVAQGASPGLRSKNIIKAP